MRKKDRITTEILRYKLMAVIDESAIAVARISGSAIVTEGNDFNFALADAAGQVLMVGPYIVAHAAALDGVITHVAREYRDNPGINPGDMFLTNNPYLGVTHQNDVALICPIFDGDELVAWCGSIAHQVDVGGPTLGMNVKADSIYAEALPIEPVKIVEGGRIRRDLEREYLIRSRLPFLNALDLRGQVAANNVAAAKFLALIGEYGRDVVLNALDELVDQAALQFRARLRELTDGVCEAVTHIEGDGTTDRVYGVHLVLTKHGERLTLDFSGSSPQAPAVININAGTLRAYVMATMMAMLCWDIPWTPVAIWRSVEIRTRKGTVTDANWPAGVSTGNMAAGAAVRSLVSVLVSRLLAGHPEHGWRARASCMSCYGGTTLSGLNERGERFATMLLDAVAGGAGALSGSDGIGTCGMINAPGARIPNVESNELLYPMLYLFRRQEPDSGGAGRYLGGQGEQHAFTPYRLRGSMCMNFFAHGVEQPGAIGQEGGFPGAPNRCTVVRGALSADALHEGRLPPLLELPGLRREVLASKEGTELNEGDLVMHLASGGGGWGDPLAREPGAIASDVKNLRVSPAAAREVFGVVLRNDLEVDLPATAGLRDEMRQSRLLCAHAAAEGMSRCTACGTTGPARVLDARVDAFYPGIATPAAGARFKLRQLVCAHCGTLLDVSVREKTAACAKPPAAFTGR